MYTVQDQCLFKDAGSNDLSALPIKMLIMIAIKIVENVNAMQWECRARKLRKKIIYGRRLRDLEI